MSNKHKWKHFIKNETSINMWDPHFNPIGCEWICSVKLKVNDSLDHNKAHLIALENKQEYGIKYDVTLAPIAKMTRVHNLGSCNFSVLATFSNGSKKCFSSWGSQIISLDVCLLDSQFHLQHMPIKISYGDNYTDWKQAPRAWFKKFEKTLWIAHFAKSKSEQVWSISIPTTHFSWHNYLTCIHWWRHHCHLDQSRMVYGGCRQPHMHPFIWRI